MRTVWFMFFASSSFMATLKIFPLVLITIGIVEPCLHGQMYEISGWGFAKISTNRDNSWKIVGASQKIGYFGPNFLLSARGFAKNSTFWHKGTTIFRVSHKFRTSPSPSPMNYVNLKVFAQRPPRYRTLGLVINENEKNTEWFRTACDVQPNRTLQLTVTLRLLTWYQTTASKIFFKTLKREKFKGMHPHLNSTEPVTETLWGRPARHNRGHETHHLWEQLISQNISHNWEPL